jgi:hypothetical protein
VIDQHEHVKSDKIINQLGYVRRDKNEYCFFPEAFKSEVCKGLDIAVVCKALRQIAALDSDGDKKRNQKTLRIPDVGARKMYVIKADQLFDTGDEKKPDIEENAGQSPATKP